MARPVLDVQPGVVLCNEGIPPVPEDTLHEIQVGYAARGCEEPDLEGLFPDVAFHRGAYHGPQKERNPALGWVLFLRGKGKDHILCRRVEGNPEQFLGRVKRNDLLVVGGGKAYVGYVEDPGSCSAVPRRVVEDPLCDPSGVHDVGTKVFAVPWKGADTGQAMAVEDEGLGRQAGPVDT